MKNIIYSHANLKDIQISKVEETKRGPQVWLKIGDQEVSTTKRFWRSFGMRFGVHSATYRHFSHAEVFERVNSKAPNMVSRFAVDGDSRSALAVSSPDKDVILPATFMRMVERYGGEKVRYHDGQYEATFKQQSGARSLNVGGDDFETRYAVKVPVDGFQTPFITLSLLRLVCANGMTAEHNLFSSIVNVGAKDSSGHTLDRAISTYDNERGYDLFARRLESSQNTLASHAEVERVHNSLVRAGVSIEAIRTFRQVTGSVLTDYNVLTKHAIDPKRLKLLPARCSVYDLINMLTEISSHHVEGLSRRLLTAEVSSLITAEYDLEGLETKKEEHTGVFFDGVTVLAADKMRADETDDQETEETGTTAEAARVIVA
jgi:hypothetical protein